MLRDHGEYHSRQEGTHKASWEAGANYGRQEVLLEQELLRVQAADIEDLTEEVLSSGRQLIQDLCCAVPVSKRNYVSPIRDLASDPQAVRWGTDATTAKLAEQNAKLGEPDSKVQLLAEEAGVPVIYREVWMTRKSARS